MRGLTSRPRARLALAAAAAAAALTLAGCTASGSGPAASSAPASTDGSADEGAARGGTLTVANSFVVKNLDPGQIYEATGLTAVRGMYETLVTFEGGDVTNPLPLVAEGWEVNEDATEFTFTIRDGITFSDGSELTADDVVFSINRLVNLKGSASVIVAGLSAASPEPGIVVISSEIPNPAVPTILAMPATSIVNADVARENGATDADDAAETDSAISFFDKTSAGSGPYKLESFDPASEIVLTVNENYWGEQPFYDRIVIQNVEAQNQKMSVERATGDYVALDIAGRMLDGLKDDLQVSSNQDTFYFLTLHQDPEVSEITSNIEFVRALRASIDYVGLAELFGEDARPAAGLVPTAFAGTLPESEAKAQDLDAAKQHLEASGLTDPQVSLMFPAITYKGVDLATIATKVQNDAAQAGITVELDPQPIASFLDAQTAGKVPFRFSPQSLNYPVASSLVNNFHPGQPSAIRTGWTLENATPEAIAAGDRVLAATEAAELDAAMQDWQRVLETDGPYIPLAYNSGVVVATPDLANAEYSPAGWQIDLRAVARR